jgi:hypothetical protein
MIVAIHQPHFLPWLGYLHRMANADLFVLLDHVQFERRNYQNRTRVLVGGEPRWLTVPVIQRSQKERIIDKEIDNRDGGARPWAPAHLATLRHAYAGAPWFSHYAAELRRIFEARWQRLVDLNHACLELLRTALAIRTPIVRSAELPVRGARGELILDICRAVGASTLLAGLGGSRGYLDLAAFERAGVRVEFQRFEHPVYPQRGGGRFVAGLSALDLVLNCGPRGARLLRGETASHESLAAA